jgi:hypothetical protein
MQIRTNNKNEDIVTGWLRGAPIGTDKSKVFTKTPNERPAAPEGVVGVDRSSENKTQKNKKKKIK